MGYVNKVSASIRDIDNNIQSFNISDLKKELGKFYDIVEAKYKVEIQLGKDRSRSNAFVGSIQVYLSKSCLNGDGDEIIYPCGDDKCTGYIEPCHIKEFTAVCPKCGKAWRLGNNTQLYDSTFYRLPLEKWVDAISIVVRKLGLNTDIYLKFRPVDIRPLAYKEMRNDRKGTELAKSANTLESVIYPMKRLITDTNGGKSLETCIRGFLNA